jgi:hypothetical protein
VPQIHVRPPCNAAYPHGYRRKRGRGSEGPFCDPGDPDQLPGPGGLRQRFTGLKRRDSVPNSSSWADFDESAFPTARQARLTFVCHGSPAAGRSSHAMFDAASLVASSGGEVQ